MTDFTPCERTIRLCLDALPFTDEFSDPCEHRATEFARRAITALLPKPDPAKTLVEAYINQSDFSPDWANVNTFARWLFETGRMK